MDVFSICWTRFQPYIFLPFCLLGRILHFRTDQVKRTIIIVAFFTLLHLIMDYHVRLPVFKGLITSLLNTYFHPFYRYLNLITCVISGNSSEVETYHKMLPLWYSSPKVLELTNSTIWHGNNVNGKLIQVTHPNMISSIICFTTLEVQVMQCLEYTSVYVIPDVVYLRSRFYTEPCTYFLDIRRIIQSESSLSSIYFNLESCSSFQSFWLFFFLSLKNLTFKLVTLLALSNAQRSQTLTALHLTVWFPFYS